MTGIRYQVCTRYQVSAIKYQISETVMEIRQMRFADNKIAFQRIVQIEVMDHMTPLVFSSPSQCLNEHIHLYLII